ncbi:rhomboid family intramembrane serine protease [Akkermansia glycaniphila]|uniref:Peptidase s54 rhomboid domain n=1 Tax=Akkermansia glycaniphila TaxID=1679444 RepID=A0A1C7PCE5_9BACT|nr:rhomboid family intramembrane serine protease [Akkermansia glycaniphila]OCA03217.1 hypothetical protein AC781_05915 [Akkermansia glycaniphila]SEI01331.1 peptidase s54 rhomboid domain [Akkermansia glycaniphila]
MDTYEYKNSPSAEPQGPFPLDLLPELRQKGYLGPGSFIRENGGEWVSARGIGIPLFYPAASRKAAWMLVALLWFLWLLTNNWHMPVDAQTGNGQPNIWTFTVDHQWWRLLTGTFLSPGAVPLCLATGLILLMGPFITPFLGTAGFLLLYVLCGIGGSFAVLEWYIPHFGSTEDIVSLYEYQSTPVPGIVSAAYGLLGAALVLCPRRPCIRDNVLAWAASVMICTVALYFFIGITDSIVPYMRLSFLGLLLGMAFASPCALVHAFRRRQCGKLPQSGHRFLSVSSACSLALWLILAGAWMNYKQTGKNSAIAAEEESRCYLHGKGKPQNNLAALARLMQAARAGYPYAYEAIAYSHMDHLPPRHRNKLHSQQYEPRQYATLAWQLNRSPEHRKRAVAWFRKAAQYGFPDAAAELGIALMNGDGCRQNLSEARLWLTHAKTRKADEALARLNVYERGLKESFWQDYRHIRNFFRSCLAMIKQD